MDDNLFIKTVSGHKQNKTPIWMMRQAGRYLAEYRAVRGTQKDFISFCLNPEQASAVTLQPIARYGFDAAIIFSDILMVPWALERNVRFQPNIGPLLDPLDIPSSIDQKLIDNLELFYHVANIGDARSLAIHPASTTHSQLSTEEQLSSGVTPGYVRLSIGIEHIDDILQDLDQALNKT